MRIDSTSKIAGFSILKIRALFRSVEFELSLERVTRFLKTTETEALHLVEVLTQDGYIVSSSESCWSLTIRGCALANASAANPMFRKTAERKITAFINRVRAIKNDPSLLYQVEQVYIFGSYLTEKSQINDIDLAVTISRRPIPIEEYEKLASARVVLAMRKGKRFRSFMERAAWPELEVWRFLKSGSRRLSLHPYQEEMTKLSYHKSIYSDLSNSNDIDSSLMSA